MTVQDVIDGFREDAEKDPERDAYADLLYQEAIRIGMELNNRYHTPEEIREIMGRLTGKAIDGFRRFIRILERISRSERTSLSIPAAIFRIRAAL